MGLTIKSRIILLGTCLAFVPALIIGFTLSQNALEEGSRSLTQNAQEKLTGVSSLTAESISTYFGFIDKQVRTFATDKAIIDAAKEFTKAFFVYEQQHRQDLAQSKAALRDYYVNEFDQQFASLNLDRSSNPTALLDQISPVATLLQANYIANNPAPLGEKDTLISAKNGSEYDAVHSHYHSMMRTFQQNFGYYDVFIADANSGNIVYSVFKELDFATSLKTGPYKDTGIGKAFAGALTASKPGDITLTDFAAYGPSYNAPASFISTPIFDGNNLIAVLIFQMPVDEINNTVNSGQNWKQVGLGNTGQSYLVGSDHTLRSNVRPFYEDKQSYLADLADTGIDQNILSEIDSLNTTISSFPIQGTTIDAALAGKSGNDQITNYLGQDVLVSYQPLTIHGLKWGLITEQSVDEALAPIAALQQTIERNTLLLSVIALIVGPLLSYVLALYITRPIKQMVHLVEDLAQGEGNLTQRLPVQSKDEVGMLANGINDFIAQIDNTLSTVLKSVVRLEPISQDTSAVINRLNAANDSQKAQADNVRDFLDQTHQSSADVAQELTDIDDSSNQGLATVADSMQSISTVSATMQTMSEDLSRALDALGVLKQDTTQITGIISVINDIAEQTNLLALNAAIEAARAGEAGRGFAVVADEVRTLASRTRESTNEVSNMVSAIQNSTSEVAKLMEESGASASLSVQQVEDSKVTLNTVNDAMEMIANKVKSIGLSISQQQSNFVEVTHSYERMNDSFEEVQMHSAESAKVGSDVMKLGHKITQQIQRFTVTDNNHSTAPRATIRDPE
ncbi:methyl-accepting chemotaxis protein [Rhodanobacter aciditrophus]|uniref:Methyl-accepting chemotaxis protein n=1 Tax=Rhodanobacter aciditrophus TaxID=1623218 RepID=A0ABW4AW05_9GAMM